MTNSITLIWKAKTEHERIENKRRAWTLMTSNYLEFFSFLSSWVYLRNSRWKIKRKMFHFFALVARSLLTFRNDYLIDSRRISDAGSALADVHKKFFFFPFSFDRLSLEIQFKKLVKMRQRQRRRRRQQHTQNNKIACFELRLRVRVARPT